jgi:hypothetical protein
MHWLIISKAKIALATAFTFIHSLEDLPRYFFPSMPLIKKLSEAKLYIAIHAIKNKGKSMAGLLNAARINNKKLILNIIAIGNNKKLRMRYIVSFI